VAGLSYINMASDRNRPAEPGCSARPPGRPWAVNYADHGIGTAGLGIGRRDITRDRIKDTYTYFIAAYEGFYEDLARQNVVAQLSQLQLRFRRRHIWVSMLSHMGFSHRRGVLKTTI
jgi:hypothetical protein